MVPPASRNRSSTSHSWRRDCGSSPVVGSSRNSSSGRPASAHATDSRCFCPPDSFDTQASRFGVELDDLEQLVDGRAVADRTSETAAASPRRSACRPAAFPAAGCRAAAAARRRRVSQRWPSTSTSPASACKQAFENLDRRGLAGAVRPEQAKAFAAQHLEVEAVDGGDSSVALDDARAAAGRLDSVCEHAATIATPSVHSPFCVVEHRVDRTGRRAARPAGAARPGRRGPDLHRKRSARSARSHHPDQAGASSRCEDEFSATSRGTALINRIKDDPDAERVRSPRHGARRARRAASP